MSLLMSFFFPLCSVPFLSLPIYVMIQLEGGLSESICVVALRIKVHLLVHVRPSAVHHQVI